MKNCNQVHLVVGGRRWTFASIMEALDFFRARLSVSVALEEADRDLLELLRLFYLVK